MVRIKWALVFLVLVVVLLPAVAQAPTEASLLAAWEANLKRDPSTATFEKIEEGRYRLKTKALPFDGEIKVLSTVVGDPFAGEFAGDYVPGTVEVELQGVGEDFFRSHATSYARWQMGNTLYFDVKANRWLTQREWQATAVKKFGRWSWVGWFSSFFWVFFLVMLAIFFGWLTRRTSRQMKTAMAAQQKALENYDRAIKLSERSVELSEEANRVLKEILEAVKEKSRGGGEPESRG